MICRSDSGVPRARRFPHCRTILVALCLTAALAGCDGTDATPSAGSVTRNSEAPSTTRPKQHTVPRPSEILQTQALAEGLAASSLTWDRAAAIFGGALESLDTHPADMAVAKAAKVLLPGYGTRDLPKGVGADATTVRANEGQADVTLYGTETAVQWFSVGKHYPEPDLRAFVARVLPGMTLEAQQPACAGLDADNIPQLFTGRAEGASRTLHVVARVDDTVKYGPPTTQLDVYTRQPTEFEIGCPATEDQGGT